MEQQAGARGDALLFRARLASREPTTNAILDAQRTVHTAQYGSPPAFLSAGKRCATTN